MKLLKRIFKGPYNNPEFAITGEEYDENITLIEDEINWLKENASAILFSYKSTTLAMAVTPLPKDGVPFIVRGSVNGTEDGHYVYNSNNGGWEFIVAFSTPGLSTATLNPIGTTEAETGKTVANYVATLRGGTVASGETKDVTGGEIFNTILLNKFKNFELLKTEQADTTKWTPASQSSIVNGLVTIRANGSQAKININYSDVVIGQKYIAIMMLEDVVQLNSKATGLRMYNYSQGFDYEYFPFTNKFCYYVFTATTTGAIQVLVLGDVNNSSTVPIATDLVSFKSKVIGYTKWTQEKEDLAKELKEYYSGGDLDFSMAAKSIYALKSKEADSAESVKSLPETSFYKVSPKGNIVTNEFSSYYVKYKSTTLTESLVDGERIISGVLDYSSSTPLARLGFDIQPTLYASEQKTFAIILEGTIKTTNCSKFSYVQASSTQTTILENLTDDVEIPFSHIAIFTYNAGQTSNFRYTYTEITRKDTSITSVNVEIKFSKFAIFDYDDSLSLSDYLKAIDGKVYFPIYMPKTVATLEYVDENLAFLNNSFETITDIGNKVKDVFSAEDFIIEWDSITTPSTNVTNKIVDGVFSFGATTNMSLTDPRAWCGFRILESAYALEEKNYVVILEGKITAVNGKNLKYIMSSGAEVIVCQDLEDNVETSFKKIVPLYFSKGYIGNNQYTCLKVTQKDTAINNVSFLAEFTTFAIFYKIDGFTEDDYIAAAESGVVRPLYLKEGIATETYVNNIVSSELSGLSSKTADNLITNDDIEMILTYGQSLAVGGGASDSSTDFKNTPTFALGSSLYSRSFTTEAEKNTYYGTQFVMLEDNSVNEQYPPATASLTTILNLIEQENKVNVDSYGYQLMAQTGGSSGSPISGINKGTTAYSNILEVIQKAKEFSNKEGKTFSVRIINWVQGEADRSLTKEAYYSLLEALFNDFNTDIKAITGQVDDVQFVTYQTSPWLNVLLDNYYDIGVQEAQLQLANDKNNVHLCGAMYQFAYGDYYHPTDRAVIGLQQGIANKRIIHDGEDWVAFQPISHKVIFDGTKYYTHLKFDVPVKPARFDVSGDLWHNPNGKQVNYGFKILNDLDEEMQISEPFIRKGDTVVFTTSENPSGFKISYATNGHYGGGNLCDSQNITIRNKSIDYVIDNFAIAFQNYII